MPKNSKKSNKIGKPVGGVKGTLISLFLTTAMTLMPQVLKHKDESPSAPLVTIIINHASSGGNVTVNNYGPKA